MFLAIPQILTLAVVNVTLPSVVTCRGAVGQELFNWNDTVFSSAITLSRVQ